MKNRYMSVLIDVLKKNKNSVIIFFAASAFYLSVFFLYDILSEPFIYAFILSFLLLIVLFIIDYVLEVKRAEKRESFKNNILISGIDAADKTTLRDSDYSEIIASLENEIKRLETEYSIKQKADDDYYTAWVHQIKTPISVMRLSLSDTSERDRVISNELFRIEQYAEMVLNYTRLESNSSDLLVMEYSLDEIIRETLRKFAPLFIMKKLKLTYDSCNITVITDKKWLSFIIEQYISNAIKYTSSGEIKIAVSNGRIEVSDTGIGIQTEDLPRIFEKGYTGSNGRLGQRSSGLGLFLVKKAADMISLNVYAESCPGEGSRFYIELPKPVTLQY